MSICHPPLMLVIKDIENNYLKKYENKSENNLKNMDSSFKKIKKHIKKNTSIDDFLKFQTLWIL